MKKHRYLYYISSLSLSLLAFILCYFVYQAGEVGDNKHGLDFLLGIPNFFFFYPIIFPFICAGVFYQAFENKNIRFWGSLSDKLDDHEKKKVLLYRKILPVVAVVASVFVIYQDTIKKDYTLPPYSFSFSSDEGYEELIGEYAKLRGWAENDADKENGTKKYIAALKEKRTKKENGTTSDDVTGFDSISSWYSESSRLHKYESLLGLLAALIISLYLAEVFLLMMVKNKIKPAVKNLIIWLLILSTFWFPVKLYSVYHFTLGEFSAPGLLWFGIFLLAFSVLIVFFIKTERNDLYKYGSIVAVLFSAGFTAVSWQHPELFEKGIQIIQSIGPVFGTILIMLVAFALYLVTDHFIDNYEQEIAD